MHSLLGKILSVSVILFWPILSVYATGIHFKKVVWIVFENESAAPTYAQADFARFANYGLALTNINWPL